MFRAKRRQTQRIPKNGVAKPLYCAYWLVAAFLKPFPASAQLPVGCSKMNLKDNYVQRFGHQLSPLPAGRLRKFATRPREVFPVRTGQDQTLLGISPRAWDREAFSYHS
jgi:hypothetical protein